MMYTFSPGVVALLAVGERILDRELSFIKCETFLQSLYCNRSRDTFLWKFLGVFTYLVSTVQLVGSRSLCNCSVC